MLKRTLSLAVLASLVSFTDADAQQSRVYDRNDNYVIDVRGNCASSNMESQMCEIGTTKAPVADSIVTNDPAKLNYEDTIVYFDFDKSFLKSNEKAKLNRLIEFVETADVEGVDVVGFADRLGTDSYNDALSKRRADVVTRYLRDKGMNGVNLADVKALGEDSSKGRCTDVVGRKATIECLWEDRKVEVRVNYRK